MTEEQRARAEKFPFSSMTYVDAPNDFVILRDDAQALVLYGFDAEQNCPALHFAANGSAPVLEVLPKGELLVSFLPETWLSAFEAVGFALRDHWRDYYLQSLDELPAVPAPCLLTAHEAAEASALTRACAGDSRGFTGQTADWFCDWLSGREENLADSDAAAPAVLLQRDELGQLIGLAATAVYGFDNPKGALCWIRELCVANDLRRRGIGRKLLAQTLHYGREHGAKRGFLAVDEQNKGAIALYRSMGFRPNEKDAGQIDLYRA